MLGFLAISVCTGMACTLTSLLGFDAGVWMAVLWYIIGCWIGFIISVAVFLVASTTMETDTDRAHPKYT